MADTEAAVRPSLPVELHAATRSEHALLNRTIIARLPLCLPCATSTPALYAQGMTVVGHIYYGFEEAWDTLLAGNTLNEEQRRILLKLNIPQLRRTSRLNTSLEQLNLKLRPSTDVQLASLQAATMHFREEVAASIVAKPHLIMAYTWTMYLALFNGGRWIAKQLLDAGSLFWSDVDRAATTSTSLSFWFFGEDEGYDGEDLKIAFKENFSITAESLTNDQRNEVVAEARKIFQMCSQMIDYLDHYTQADELQQATRTVSNSTCPEEMKRGSSAFEYLGFFTPSPVASLWRSLMNKIPMSQTMSNALLRRDIEQKHG